MNFSSILKRFWSPAIAVYADFMDPFCYIGFHNLRLAAADARIALAWRGFEFNADTPEEGYFLESAANSDLRPGMWASVKSYANRSGLDFPEPQRVPNTAAAHALVQGVRRPDVKIPLIERIYQAYFNERQDIGQPEVLIAIAESFDLGPVDLKKSPAMEQLMQRYRQEAESYQFPGLPGFRFKGRSYFGALPQDAWRKTFAVDSKPLKEAICSTK